MKHRIAYQWRLRQIMTDHGMHNLSDLITPLHEVGIEDEENFAAMAKKAAAGCVGSFVPLEENDIVEIYRAAL